MRVRHWILQLALIQFLMTVGWVMYIHAQSQETVNALIAQRVGTIEARVGDLERHNSAARITALEADMAEVKWLGRSVAALVSSQLVTMILGMRRKEHGGR